MNGRATAVAAVTMLAAVTVATAQPLHDPALRFQTLRTPHFSIDFHDGEAADAARLAAIAEGAWLELAARLGPAPPPLTHVVLVDETELANGSAYPVPYDTVVVTAAWPAGSDYIGNTDDWLRLVFTHEFTHIVHLDRSESWARIVRGTFGRVPLAFPNLFLPAWQIEGLATFEESTITGEGRLHAGDFQQITQEAARTGGFEPFDRVNGGLTDWPGGLGAYAYGLGFHAYLAERYGSEKFRELADRTARRVPYFAAPVFRAVYGRSLGELWAEYEAATSGALAVEDEGARGERLTHHGFYVSGPRFTPAGIVYTVRTPHEFPALYQLTSNGPRRITTRYLGSTSGVSGEMVVFDQQEIRRNAGLYSDLYALDLRTRDVRALTRNRRLIDPDLSDDGSQIAAVRQSAGRRDLVVLGTGDPSGTTRVLASAPGTQFNAPRWSPSARQIVAERHRPGTLPDIIVVDVDTGSVQPIDAPPGTRMVTPTWTRNGRSVIVAAAAGDDPFQLLQIDPATGDRRTLTSVPGGALWPEMSPDGASLVYVGYTTDGFDLFRLPYDGGIDRGNQPLATNHQPPATNPQRPLIPNPQSPPTVYSPLPTLAPRWWIPVVAGDRNAIRFGAATGGNDVLGYHAYAASATWLATFPDGAPLPSRAEPDWQVSYGYLRWRPAFYLSASSETSFFAGPATESGAPSQLTLRERQIEATVLFPVRHVRAAHAVLASFVTAADEFAFANQSTTSLTRAALRGGWSTRTAHVFGYSIGPERGVTVGATVERVDTAFGASADALAETGDARAYLPGFSRHDVFALRIAGGTSSGDPALRRTFHLGGAGPDADPIDFGSNAISVLRGFPADTFAGRNIALTNVEYRVPLARVERGAGTWPLFLRTVHAAVFADAGHAWTRTFRLDDLKTSAGAELSLDLVAGYSLPITLTAGAAYGHDGSERVRPGTTAYVRIGRAF